MTNQTQSFIKNENAKNEPPVAAYEILAEIKPLLKDYFAGKISLNGDSIEYCLPNGQKFKLSVKELA